MENNYLIPAIGLFAFFAALIIVRVFLSRLIRFAHKKNMLDVPVGRKAHKSPTPTSGGLAFGNNCRDFITNHVYLHFLGNGRFMQSCFTCFGIF